MSFRVEWKNKNDIKGNKTTIFLLPTFGYSKSFYTQYLIDCYIKDITSNQIVICFQNVDDIRLTEQIYRLCAHHGFQESYTDDEDKELVILMSIDKEFYLDFKRFLEGRYSKFSNNLKDLLMKQNEGKTGKDHKVSVFDVLYPKEEKATQIAEYLDVNINEIPNELLDKPNLEVELYKTIEELKNYAVKNK